MFTPWSWHLFVLEAMLDARVLLFFAPVRHQSAILGNLVTVYVYI